jgi:predicted PurR-regulated permease PerM
MQARTLIRFCQKIGVQPKAVKEAEAPDGYHLAKDVSAGDLKRISVADLGDLTTEFSDALSLQIGIPDGPPLLEITQGTATTDLAQALQHIAQRADALDLLFDLSLDKASILKQYQLPGDQGHALFYLFKENLERFLRSPLLSLDDILFTARYRPTTVVVSDARLRYEGRLLTIVGADDAEPALTVKSTIPQNLRSRIDRYHATASDSLSWVGFQFKRLTPLHFLCKKIDGEIDGLESTLTDHLLHLCILYTANRSSLGDGYFQAWYAGSERTAALTLEAGVAVPNADGLLPRLALWPHSGIEADRLTIFQNVAARELDSEDSSENYGSFTAQLCHLLDEARWHHRVFLDGQIDRHFEQVQKVIDYIADMTKEMSQALESVTKTLTDALLATVGVIVLTLVASLVKNETQNTIFKIGMRAYAIYLLLFQGLYRMGSLGHSYILLKREADEQLANYAPRLDKNRVETLASPLERRKVQFQLWFVLTIIVYLAVIVLIWVLGASLPYYLTQLGVLNPTLSTTPALSAVPTPTP